MMGICLLCPEGDNTVPDHDLIDHMRVLHPEQYGDGPERWPDGSMVVHDETLTPEDFS